MRKKVEEGCLLIGLADDHYNEMEGLRASQIKRGATSMKSMRNPGIVTQSDAMRLGTLFHQAMADPDFLKKLIIYEGIRRGKSWDAFKSDSDLRNKIVVRPRELALITSQLQAVHAHPMASSIIKKIDQREVSCRWRDVYGWGKCRFDGIGNGFYIDYKTTSTLNPRQFLHKSEGLGYPLQFGWYGHGYEQQASEFYGQLQHAYVIAVGVGNDPDVVVYEVSHQTLAEAYLQAKNIAVQYDACVRSDYFPGVADHEIIPWERPSYATTDDTATVIIDGKKINI